MPLDLPPNPSASDNDPSKHPASEAASRASLSGKEAIEAEPESMGFGPVLRNANFLVLWSGQIFSQLADKVYLVLMIAIIASRFQGLDQSISGWVSALMIVFTIPAVLFGFVAGVFVDRWSKKGVLVISNLLRGLLVMALPALLWLTHGWGTIANLPVGFFILLGVTFLVSTLTQFFAPAEQAVIPLIVKRQHLLSANSLYTTTMMASVIVGFALGEPVLALADTLMLKFGGLLSGIIGEIDAGKLDTGKELLVGAGYAIAGLILILMRTRESRAEGRRQKAEGRRQKNPPLTPPKRGTEPPQRLNSPTPQPPNSSSKIQNPKSKIQNPQLWADVKDGLAFLKHTTTVRAALIQLIILFSIVAALAVLAVRLAEVIPVIEADQFGFLLAAGGVGMGLGAAILGQFGQRFSNTQLNLMGSLGMSLCLMILASVTQYLVPCLVYIGGIGLFAAFIGIPMQTTIQAETPESMRGKVFGLQNNAVNIALSLPLALAGIAETLWGLPIVLLGLSGLVIAGGLLTWYSSTKGSAKA